MIFVFAPTQKMFEDTCKKEWSADPRSSDFFVMTNTMQFMRKSRGREWQEGDEVRLIAPADVDGRVFAYAFAAILTPMGMPDSVADFLRPHLPVMEPPSLEDDENAEDLPQDEERRRR